jgi:hypothetical protein
LFDDLHKTKQLVTCTAGEGAGRHCEPRPDQLEQRMFDWLEETLASG